MLHGLYEFCHYHCHSHSSHRICILCTGLTADAWWATNSPASTTANHNIHTHFLPPFLLAIAIDNLCERQRALQLEKLFCERVILASLASNVCMQLPTFYGLSSMPMLYIVRVGHTGTIISDWIFLCVCACYFSNLHGKRWTRDTECSNVLLQIYFVRFCNGNMNMRSACVQSARIYEYIYNHN